MAEKVVEVNLILQLVPCCAASHTVTESLRCRNEKYSWDPLARQQLFHSRMEPDRRLQLDLNRCED